MLLPIDAKMLALFLLLSLTTSTAIEHNIGIHLTKQPYTLRSNHGYGSILLHANIKTEFNPPTLHKCTNQTTLCMSHKNFDIIIKDAEGEVLRDLYKLQEIIKHFEPPKYNKRGILNIIGEGSKYLFGTATQSDIKNVYSHMKQMFDTVTEITNSQITQHLVKVGKQLDSHFTVLSREMMQITTATEQLDGIVGQNRRALNMILRQQHRIFDSKLPHLEYLHKLQYRIKLYTRSLITLQKGFLPEGLIPFTQLQGAMMILRSAITTQDPSADIAMDLPNILRLYDIPTCEAFIIRHNLFIRIPIPIVRPDTELAIYQAITHPVPIQHTGGYTLVSLKSDFLAVTKDGTRFAELSKTELDSCQHHGFVCPHLISLRPADKPTCLISVLHKYPPDTIVNNCNPKVFHQKPPPLVLALNYTHTLIQSPSDSATLHCKGTASKTIKLARSQVMQIPCGCFITSAEMTTMIRGCNNNSSLSIQYPFNMPIMDKLKGIVPHDKILQLAMPNNSNNLPQLTRIINESSSTEFGADLSTVMNKVKQLAKHGSWQIPEANAHGTWSTAWTHTIVLSAIGIWLIILTLLNIQSWLQRRAMHAYLITRLPMTNAISIFPNQQTPTTADNVTIHLPALLWIGIYTLLFVIVLVLTRKLMRAAMSSCQQLYRTAQCLQSPEPHSDTWQIFVKISDGINTNISYLLSIPNEGIETIFTATPICTTAELHYGLISYMRFNWSGTLQYTVNGHRMRAHLPQEISISGRAAKRLRQILSKDYSYSLLCKSPAQGAYIALPKQGTNESFCPSTSKECNESPKVTLDKHPPAYGCSN